jgi:RNA polymerase sigma-70 factor, ECF subfamily
VAEVYFVDSQEPGPTVSSDRREQDRELILRARDGDRQAFGDLVRHYQRRVYITALQLTRNHSDADDLTQETFIKAFRGLDGFDFRADFFTWLYRITVNTTLNLLNRAHRTRNVSLDDDALLSHAVDRLLAGSEDPRKRLEARNLYGKVLEAIDTLKPELRITLVLYAIQGRSQKEIAEIVDCAEGTVAWRISEARRLLRSKLSRTLHGERTPTDGLSRDEKEPFGLP